MKRAERVEILRDAQREAAGALSGLLHGRHATFERKLQASRELLSMAQHASAPRRVTFMSLPPETVLRLDAWQLACVLDGLDAIGAGGVLKQVAQQAGVTE